MSYFQAFQTPTGMPYGTVNLQHGVNPGETPITCTAGIGTFIVEFATLSHLTGDPVFEDVARKALKTLWKNRSDIGLVSENTLVTFQVKRWNNFCWGKIIQGKSRKTKVWIAAGDMHGYDSTRRIIITENHFSAHLHRSMPHWRHRTSFCVVSIELPCTADTALYQRRKPDSSTIYLRKTASNYSFICTNLL